MSADALDKGIEMEQNLWQLAPVDAYPESHSERVVESMNTRRGKLAIVAVFTSAFFLGITSVALATEVSGANSVFYGPVKIAGTYLCGSQQPWISNDSGAKGALSYTFGWSNTSCSNPDERPASQLGAIAYLWRGTSGSGGVLYGDSGWEYNSFTNQNMEATWYCGGLCPSGYSYYTAGKGRFWNSDAQTYETASYFSYSPNLNF